MNSSERVFTDLLAAWEQSQGQIIQDRSLRQEEDFRVLGIEVEQWKTRFHAATSRDLQEGPR